ncbi:putative photosystem I [Lupinus albus]|uniref:Putative photosystem I n=1 Tax=Lupinus albus TaxID=3870 RepID=A0A6A4PNG4_LUPAL|nr:putative photosystem I [Lupinus albus]
MHNPFISLRLIEASRRGPSYLIKALVSGCKGEIDAHNFLWAQATQVIQSYSSSLSAYGLFFLGAHFVWAFSLMFLFSGRGYWQELIESIVWAHNKLKVAPAIQPKALSIVQGRAVGVTHYLLGGIATTWAFFLATNIAVG